MKKYILALAVMTLIWALGAEIHSNAGEYGYQFLNIPVNPVGLALAGRGIHSQANQASWIWQPASSAAERGRSVGASHHIWISDTAYSSLAYSNSNRKSHLGLALINLSYGKIDKRDETGLLIGEYSPADLAVKGNYSLRLYPSIYLGMNLGVLYQKIDTASSLGIFTDLGSTWLPPIKDSKISVAVRNLGVSNKTDEERVDFPHSIDLDIYKGITLGEQHLGIEGSLRKAVDDHTRLSVSAELCLLQSLFLRAGYQSADAAGLSAGAGFQISRFAIDYAYGSFDEGLQDVHSFGLSYHF